MFFSKRASFVVELITKWRHWLPSSISSQQQHSNATSTKINTCNFSEYQIYVWTASWKRKTTGSLVIQKPSTVGKPIFKNFLEICFDTAGTNDTSKEILCCKTLPPTDSLFPHSPITPHCLSLPAIHMITAINCRIVLLHRITSAINRISTSNSATPTRAEKRRDGKGSTPKLNICSITSIVQTHSSRRTTHR